MSDPHDHYEDDFDNDGCWNCGGVGRVNDCVDGCCVDQDDPWCPYCSERCDICNPKPKVVDTGDDLHQILGDALKTANRTSDQ
jgi:hypothetical protein